MIIPLSININRFLLSSFLCFLLTGIHQECLSQSQELEEQKKISVLNDSLLILDPAVMQVYRNHLFLTTFSKNTLIEMDTEFNLVRTFGQSGSGPGEFDDIGEFVVWNDSIYVFDMGSMNFHVFDLNSGYKRSIPTYNNHFPALKFTLDQDGNIYFISNRPNNPITVISTTGKLINQFRTNNSDEEELYNFANNNAYLLNKKDKLILVYESRPLIKIFDLLNGKLFKTISLSNHEVLEEATKKNENELRFMKSMKTTFTLFDDAYLTGNNLYVPLYQKVGTKILVFEITSDWDFKLKQILKTPGDQALTSVCANGKEIFAYDIIENQLINYKID